MKEKSNEMIKASNEHQYVDILFYFKSFIVFFFSSFVRSTAVYSPLPTYSKVILPSTFFKCAVELCAYAHTLTHSLLITSIRLMGFFFIQIFGVCLS